MCLCSFLFDPPQPTYFTYFVYFLIPLLLEYSYRSTCWRCIFTIKPYMQCIRFTNILRILPNYYQKYQLSRWRLCSLWCSLRSHKSMSQSSRTVLSVCLGRERGLVWPRLSCHFWLHFFELNSQLSSPDDKEEVWISSWHSQGRVSWPIRLRNPSRSSETI